MARDYGRVHTAFWSHPKVRSCSDRGKLLANYLMTGPHSNTIGAYLLPDAYVADDLSWSSEAVSKAFAELFEIGFCERMSDGRHIIVCDFLDWNPIENPNVGKAAMKQLAQLPNDPALVHVFNGLKQYAKQLGNGFETVCERFRNIEPNLTEPEPEPNDSAAPSALTPADPPIVLIPTNRKGEEFPVSKAQADEFAELYPSVNVQQQLREMRAWAIANPDRRKTSNGMLKFVNTWLAREQDKPGGGGRAPPKEPAKPMTPERIEELRLKFANDPKLLESLNRLQPCEATH